MVIEIKEIYDISKRVNTGGKEITVNIKEEHQSDTLNLARAGDYKYDEHIMSNSAYSSVFKEHKLITSPEKLVFLLDKLVELGVEPECKFSNFYISVGYAVSEDTSVDIDYGKFYSNVNSITMLDTEGKKAVQEILLLLDKHFKLVSKYFS